MSKKPRYPALVLVEFRGEAVPRCERHAKLMIELTNLAGKYAPVDVNHRDDECDACLKEEKNRHATASKGYNHD